MERPAICIIGFLSGFLYNESIYRRAKKGKNPIVTFPVRFFLLSVLVFFIVYFYKAEGAILFTISHLLGRFFQLFFRVRLN
ncbi:hypothetical protein [Aquifex aeolicus]|uniref:hypothetical protein n=1 Tax=Aquifex aeolicus TaxID=63363 RepID=UPI0013E8F4DC|nr:hypothetical protein [Aquifex aeolicus]